MSNRRALDTKSHGAPTNGRFAFLSIDSDGDTAKPSKYAGGGIITSRLVMSSEDAIALYRAEKKRRAA